VGRRAVVPDADTADSTTTGGDGVIFRASGMPRLMACAGSYLLNKDVPRKHNPAADEGTHAAAVAARHLVDGSATASNSEMSQAVALYLETCRGLLTTATHFGVEDGHRVTANGSTISGAADFWVYDGHTLTVVDFKYGHGWVEAYMNWQLITYAALIAAKHGINPVQVRVMIVQPRANHPAGPVRDWDFLGTRLADYSGQMWAQALLASKPGAPAKTSDECRYCPSMVECHPNRKAAAYAVEMASAAEKTDVKGDALSHELAVVTRAAKLLKNRLTALETYAKETAKAGGVVPGYSLEPTYSSLKWDINPVAVADTFPGILREPEAITPTQAVSRKILTKAEVSFMASRQSTGHKLKANDLQYIAKIIKQGATT